MSRVEPSLPLSTAEISLPRIAWISDAPEKATRLLEQSPLEHFYRADSGPAFLNVLRGGYDGLLLIFDPTAHLWEALFLELRISPVHRTLAVALCFSLHKLRYLDIVPSAKIILPQELVSSGWPFEPDLGYRLLSALASVPLLPLIEAALRRLCFTVPALDEDGQSTWIKSVADLAYMIGVSESYLYTSARRSRVSLGCIHRHVTLIRGLEQGRKQGLSWSQVSLLMGKSRTSGFPSFVRRNWAVSPEEAAALPIKFWLNMLEQNCSIRD